MINLGHYSFHISIKIKKKEFLQSSQINQNQVINFKQCIISFSFFVTKNESCVLVDSIHS